MEKERPFDAIKRYINGNSSAKIIMRESADRLVVDIWQQKTERHILVRYYPEDPNPVKAVPMPYKMHFEILIERGGDSETDSEENWFKDEEEVIQRLKTCTFNYRRKGWLSN